MRLSLFLALLLAPCLAAAQPSVEVSLPEWAAPSAPPAPTPASASMVGPGTPSDPQQVPLDGGLGLLALAGGAYAAKRLRSRAAAE